MGSRGKHAACAQQAGRQELAKTKLTLIGHAAQSLGVMEELLVPYFPAGQGVGAAILVAWQ